MTKEIYIQELSDKGYKNLRDYFDNNKDENSYNYALFFENGSFVFLNDELSFYYLKDRNRFVYDELYLDLPFSEYSDYGMDNTKLSCAPAIGGADIDIINEVVKLYEIINNVVINNPFGFEISIFLLGCMVKAIKVLKQETKRNGYFWNIFEFCKKHNINISLKTITNKNYGKKEEEQINEGLKMFQKLNDLGLLQKVINEYNKSQKYDYNEKQNKHIDEKG